MRDFVRKPKNWIIITIIIGMILALLMNLFSASKSNLPEYQPAETPPAEGESKVLDIEYTTYQAENLPLSMTVPAEWTFVTQGGSPTYINKNDGAKISFSISSYIASVNSATEEQICNGVVNSGGLWGGYNRLDNSSYIIIYELDNTDYFELTTWDLSSTVSVQFAIPAARYDYYYDTVIHLYDSFAWNKENPIPEDYWLFYNDYGNFEFGIPSGWLTTVTDGIFSATNPDTGSIMYVSVSEVASDLSNVTQIDYIAVASQNRSNYLLSTYTNNGSYLIAEATYSSGGTQYSFINNILVANGFMYEFTFECSSANYNSDGQAYLSAVNLFRVLQ